MYLCKSQHCCSLLYLLVSLQGIMLDIVCMLFNILRAYLPAEIRWSNVLVLYDTFSWNICMATILYCIFFTLW